MNNTEYIIGIDDTDNLESRGTGHLARTLSEALGNVEMVEQKNIVRHQLLVDSRIPYTSHNSSASIVVNILCDIKKIIDFCRDFLVRESAEGSDVGLCIVDADNIDSDITEWGSRAKKEVLNMSEAINLADRKGLFLEGLRGTKGGIIGSLAAVGLRKIGNDGRVLWLRNLRETNGIFKLSELKKMLRIDAIVDTNYKDITSDAYINTGEWLRPVMLNGKITLIAEKTGKSSNHQIIKSINQNYEWQIASKEFIKSISE